MIFFKIAAAAAALIYFAVKVKFGFHMLQQESYLNTGYLKWVSKNLQKNIWAADVLPPLAGGLISLMFPSAGLAVWAAAGILAAVIRIKAAPKAKKPLVVTARVKRLIVTAAVFGVLLGAALYFSSIILSAAAAAAVNVCSFIFVAFVNIVNRPLELGINRWYCSDAKKMIEQAPNLTVVGITGSYGKTSSKFILSKILSEKYSVLMTPESYNTTMGVVRTVREHLKRTHEIFVCEMGAKYVNDIKEICDITNPEYGIITSIGPQHLETFKSMDNIVKTKLELFDALKKPENAVMNVSSEPVKKNLPERATAYSLEKEDGGEYYAENISYGCSGAKFTMCGKEIKPFELETKLLGKHNILNIVGAATMALKLGVSPREIAAAVKRLEPVEHRLQLKRGVGGISVIDDAFNSNVEGAKSAVEVLGSFPEGGRMLITPGMIELGEKEFEYNFEFGRHAAKYCDYIILVGDKQTKPIKQGIEKEGFDISKLYVAADLNDALAKMNTIACEGWTVLFENDLPDLYV